MNHSFIELLDLVEAEIGELSGPVFLVWNGALPILRVQFTTLRMCSAVILDADFDVWIICPAKGWCIEKYDEGERCYGTARPFVPDAALDPKAIY